MRFVCGIYILKEGGGMGDVLNNQSFCEAPI